MQEVRSHSMGQLSAFTLLKVILLFASILAIYWTDLSIVFREALNSDLSSYVLILPFLVAYLLYRKRNALKAAISFDTTNRKTTIDLVEGTTVVAAALAFYWTSSFSANALSYHTLTIPFFLGGATLTLFGKSTARTALYPTTLLVFMTPLPEALSTYLGAILSNYTTFASVSVIRLLGVNAITIPQYGTPLVQYSSLANEQVTFAVSIACSGLYSLTGFAAFALFAAYFPSGKLYAKITLFGIGFAIVYALNILRVTIILMMGRFYGEGAALETFHTFGGTLLIFIGTLGILFLGEKVWKLKFARAPVATPKSNHDESHIGLLGGFCSSCGRLIRFSTKVTKKREIGSIAIITALTLLMLSAQVPILAYAQGPNPDIFSITPGNTAPLNLLPVVNLTQSSWTPSFQYRDLAFEQVTSPYMDAAWVYAYLTIHGTSGRIFSMATSVELSPILAFLDPPHRSLLDVPSVDKVPNGSYVLSPVYPTLLSSPFVQGDLFVYTDGLDPGIHKVVISIAGADQPTRVTFRKGASYVTDYFMIALHTTAEDLAAVGLISDVNNQTQIIEVMSAFATQIVQYWEPVNSASVLAEYLTSIRQSILPWLTVALLAGAIYSGFREISDSPSDAKLAVLVSRLQAPEDKALLKDIFERCDGETAEEARLRLSEKGFEISQEEVSTKLTAAERLGIIRRRLQQVGEGALQKWVKPHGSVEISRIWSWRRTVK